MSKFNIGDKVIVKNDTYFNEEVGAVVGIDLEKDTGDGKYLVKFDSLDIFSGWVNEDDLVKVEDEYEENEYKKGIMSKFNIGDKVFSNDGRYLSEEVGTIVGIDTRENASNKYLVKFDSLDISEGWAYGCFRDISLLIIEPYDGYAIWLDDLVKAKDKYEKDECEEECEEDIRTKFESVRKQKEETIKEMNEKVLELTLEIKEIEHEIEKIKKEWHL